MGLRIQQTGMLIRKHYIDILIRKQQIGIVINEYKYDLGKLLSKVTSL
jgi:hypothetical protein